MARHFYLFTLIVTLLIFIKVSSADKYCSDILPLANTGLDSTSLIQLCIDECESGGILTLPVGRFSLSRGVVLKKTIKIISEGISKPCSTSDESACPILQALPSFYSPIAIVSTVQGASSIWLERIVIDGNKENRLGSQTTIECSQNVNNRNSGRNIFLECDGCTFANSVVANAVCASGFVFRGSNMTIQSNIFLDNGDQSSYLMWADGLTCLTCDYSRIIGNIFQGNSDIDLILGSGVETKISSNRFIHDFSRKVFGALMLDNFNGGTSGNFTSLSAVQNTIDCSGSSCCYGIELGPHPWYASNPIGGGFVISGNTINGASVGINIDAAGYSLDSAVTLDSNAVSKQIPGSSFTCTWLCDKPQPSSTINVSPDSVVVYTSGVNKPTSARSYQCSK